MSPQNLRFAFPFMKRNMSVVESTGKSIKTSFNRFNNNGFDILNSALIRLYDIVSVVVDTDNTIPGLAYYNIRKRSDGRFEVFRNNCPPEVMDNYAAVSAIFRNKNIIEILEGESEIELYQK